MSRTTTTETGWAIRLEGGGWLNGMAFAETENSARVYTDRRLAARDLGCYQWPGEIVPITRTIIVEIGEPEESK